MLLETAVQRRARQVRDRCLERVKTVVQRQKCMPPECDDKGLFLFADKG